MSKILLCCFLILAVLASIGVVKYQSDAFAMVGDSLAWMQGLTDLFYDVKDLFSGGGTEKYVIVKVGTVYHYIVYETQSSDSSTFSVTGSSLPSLTKFHVNQGFVTVNLIFSDGTQIKYCPIYKQPFVSDLVTVQSILDDLNGSHGGGGTDF